MSGKINIRWLAFKIKAAFVYNFLLERITTYMKMCVLSLEAHTENSEFLVVTAGKIVTVLVINTIPRRKSGA